ncbi:MAG: leucine-rich repeat domain-containing protein [Oscillospiraceae bacterium]|nr:leucine-rich repeat domain-containing protein [Oscillospiraceae bacterium]
MKKFKTATAIILTIAITIGFITISPVTAQVFTGDGWEFDSVTGTLTIITTDGATAWRSGRPTGFSTADVKKAIILKDVKTGFISPGNIWHNAFAMCPNLNEIKVDSENPELSDVDGVLFGVLVGLNGHTSLYRYPEGRKDTSYTVPDGTLRIMTGAFAGNESLTEVTIPDSLGGMYTRVFQSCINLKSINYPGLGSIGDYVFSNTAFTEFKIPDSARAISTGGFAGCKDLKSVEISDNSSLEIISYYAFQGTALTEIVLPESLTDLWGSPFPTTIEWVRFRGTIPPRFNAPVFDNTINLRTIYVPVGAKAAYMAALKSEETYLETVEIVELETTVNWSFENGTLTALNNSSTATWRVQSGSAFGIEDVQSVVLGNNVTGVNWAAFSGCQNLASVTFPDSPDFATIGAYAFQSTALTQVTIPNSVTNILQAAFVNIPSLNSVKLPTNPGFTSIDNSVFLMSGLTSITIPDSVTTIKHSAFSRCVNLTSVTIQGNVESIEAFAFADCENLETMTFAGANPPTFGNDAFRSTDKLHTIYVPFGSKAEYEIALASVIDDSVRIIDGSWNFANGTLTIYSNDATTAWRDEMGDDFVLADVRTVIIGDSVTEIEANAFSGCGNLTEVTIPDSVTSIVGANVFVGCTNLSKINVHPDNTAFSDIGGVLFDKYQTVIIQYPSAKTGTSYIIPDTVTHIGELAFAACRYLTSMTVGENVANIGSLAFAACLQLETMTFEGETPPEFGTTVFYLTTKFNTICVPYEAIELYREESQLAGFNIHDYNAQTNCTVAVNCKLCSGMAIPAKAHVHGEQTNCTIRVDCDFCEAEAIPAKDHVYEQQTDLTKAVYCDDCDFKVFEAKRATEVSIVDGKVEIRNNTNVFFSTKGLYLTDGTNVWALPVVVVRARSAVVIGGGKRGFDLSGVGAVWLVNK